MMPPYILLATLFISHHLVGAQGCDPGYVLDSATNTCKDIDECLPDGGATCNQLCVNTAGSYTCLCYANYKLLDSSICIPEESIKLKVFFDMDYLSDYSDTATDAYKTLVGLIEAHLLTKVCIEVKKPVLQCKLVGPVSKGPGGQKPRATIVAYNEDPLTTSQKASIAVQLKELLLASHTMLDDFGGVINIIEPVQLVHSQQLHWNINTVCDFYNNTEYCKNGGHCQISGEGTPECVCKHDFYGEDCDINIDETVLKDAAQTGLDPNDKPNNSSFIPELSDAAIFGMLSVNGVVLLVLSILVLLLFKKAKDPAPKKGAASAAPKPNTAELKNVESKDTRASLDTDASLAMTATESTFIDANSKMSVKA